MTIKQASLKKMGKGYKISPHFTLSEMACRDGSDAVLYSTELMAKLEALREYIGGSVVINSGYRTPSYNKKIGGASLSQHTRGTAADVAVLKNGKAVPAKLICCLAQSLGFRGIGYISETAVHLDMRLAGYYRGDERRGYSGNVGGDFYRYFGIKKEQVEALRPAAAAKAAQKETEEETMTQKQFNEMMDVYLKEKAKEDPAAWSKEARDWAEKNGIINGTGTGMEYKSGCTREMMVTFLYRLYRLIRG